MSLSRFNGVYASRHYWGSDAFREYGAPALAVMDSTAGKRRL